MLSTPQITKMNQNPYRKLYIRCFRDISTPTKLLHVFQCGGVIYIPNLFPIPPIYCPFSGPGNINIDILKSNELFGVAKNNLVFSNLKFFPYSKGFCFITNTHAYLYLYML